MYAYVLERHSQALSAHVRPLRNRDLVLNYGRERFYFICKLSWIVVSPATHLLLSRIHNIASQDIALMLAIMKLKLRTQKHF